MTDDQIHPDVSRVHAERAELIRLCAERVVSDHEAGRGDDQARLEWARGVVAAIPKLRGPLSDGVIRSDL